MKRTYIAVIDLEVDEGCQHAEPDHIATCLAIVLDGLPYATGGDPDWRYRDCTVYTSLEDLQFDIVKGHLVLGRLEAKKPEGHVCNGYDCPLHGLQSS